MRLYIGLLLILTANNVELRKIFSDGDWECPGNGLYPDPDNCQMFYDCANMTPFHESCGVGTYFDEHFLICNYIDQVDCGDRPGPGSTRPPQPTTLAPTTHAPTTKAPTTSQPTTAAPTTQQPTTQAPTTQQPTTAKPTTLQPSTAGPTTAGPSTAGPTTAGPTTARPTTATNSPGFPSKVLGMYILLADDFEEGFEDDADWTPRLYEYQQLGANVLFFTFINPATMEVPLAFQKLAASRGSDAEGSVPADTIIMFAIGGYAYSYDPNPWQWLTSREEADIMAEKVATWKDLYGIDGIDLDIESGAGDQAEAGPNLVYFINKLKSMQPDFIISQPTYGYPQVQAEIDVINNGWSPSTDRENSADSIGLMVYEGTQALNYVKNYAEATSQWEGFPIQVDVPRSDILLGCKGSSSPATISQLAAASINDNLLGIMVWYASVVDGLKYQASWDSSDIMETQEAYVQAMELFKQNM